ncbi:AAA family ATPase [Prevotella melaninogenica]|uniref:AAA domain-containing protein n=1 Tax=Prevotella melaninogenica TaxID=28132 RepID=UPI001BAA95A0|nr:AAA domain-containing protein [Prevotella melaninogenica]QUB63672.1 AAA family ATPase [Prevotella melaninogenica]
MDAKQCMIVDLERRGDKNMFITEQVASIKRVDNGNWIIRFSNSPRIFQYNRARILYLTYGESINLHEKGLYVGNKRITDAVELLKFSDKQHTFYRVTYCNGYSENLDGRNVYVTRTPIDVCGGSTWDYLRKLADETGLLTEDEESILSKQYELIDLKRDNVPLAQYLGNKTKLATYRLPQLVYYPFGCNASQKKAVEAALTHQASIIQGPPGTGKTQTILNIVSNLLVQKKSILVVSNNNSAVENVAEKLEKEGLGFLVAQLGSVRNKERFVELQTGCYPNMEEWHLDNSKEVRKLAKESLTAVSLGFTGRTRLALLKAEYDALITEKKYDEMLKVGVDLDNEWLSTKHSFKIMKLLNLCKMMQEQGISPNLWFCLKWAFLLDFRTYSLLRNNLSVVIERLESAYYVARKFEIEQEIDVIEQQLLSVDVKESAEELRQSSLQILKQEIAKRYGAGRRVIFTRKDIKAKTEEFLKEYPIVLSTTYSAKSCISNDFVFDYIIMDEASQVDIKTGALALSCALNVVIVGDDMQLPNVVSAEEEKALNAIKETYNVDERYNAVTHSFLRSCAEVLKDAPSTLLREHYRCHPKIIQFCNHRFYGGELIAMTKDSGEKDVLQVIRTVKGNHAREHFNQREIDVIVQEVMPLCEDKGSVGIITPYRTQAEAINRALGKYIASTVHKYQGRECDTIIMSMVDNLPTSFSDDKNLLNVAISRAKSQLYIVTSGNEMPEDTNIAQLISYARYNNFAVKDSKIHSVFDLLYQQYTVERLAYQAEHAKVSNYMSENLVYDLLVKVLDELSWKNLSVVCHYPLAKIISDWSLLTSQEKDYAKNALTHIDFLIYNSLTKQPMMAIEVDGWHYHNDKVVQQYRDRLKNQILEKYSLPPYRISTTDTITSEGLKAIFASL